jgi:hypothetical protein
MLESIRKQEIYIKLLLLLFIIYNSNTLGF